MRWMRGTSDSSVRERRNKNIHTDKLSGGIPSTAAARRLAKEIAPDPKGMEFYELEAAEVMNVIITEEQLDDLPDGDGKDWSGMGAIVARMVDSQKNDPIQILSPVRPLDPTSHEYPVRGEYVVLVTYVGRQGKETYYTNKINLLGSPNENILPGKSGVRPDVILDEEKDGKYIYDHFEPDPEIRNLFPYEGDNIYQGRFGHSIRFGSNIVPDAHDDAKDTQKSPNILIRTGQLIHADKFDKLKYVEELKDSPIKPVKEDINADGSSIWLTTDQSVKLKKDKPEVKIGHPSNSRQHKLMSKVHRDKNPIDGGPQIVINTDRLTFNTKRREIFGYSAGGIGWSTPWSFTIDADKQFCVATDKIRFYTTTEFNVLIGSDALEQVVGGGSPESGDPEAFPSTDDIMGNQGIAGLTIGEKVYITSRCPSFLKLDDMAHLESCKGAFLHLDDCAGITANSCSFLRIGGKKDEIKIYVDSRKDADEQHIVFGNLLIEFLEKMIDAFLGIDGIITPAGPSGPLKGSTLGSILMDPEFKKLKEELPKLLAKPL